MATMGAYKPKSGTLQHELTRGFVGLHTVWYRATGGLVGGWLGGPILLLTTTGRKSGAPRTLPLLYLRTDRGYALVASYGGSDRHPAWYLNLEAYPEAEVQIGPLRKKARAETVGPERRAELWPKLVRLYAGYEAYQSLTEREIPVVEIVVDDN